MFAEIVFNVKATPRRLYRKELTYMKILLIYLRATRSEILKNYKAQCAVGVRFLRVMRVA